MARWRDLRQFFWEQVAEALQVQRTEIKEQGMGFGLQVVLSGTLNGFSVNTGTYWDSREVPYTFAFVAVEDLPAGLEIGGAKGRSTQTNVARVSCGDSEVKEVAVQAVPIDLGGLRLEQVSVDLDEFLTPARREALCTLISSLVWNGDDHLVRIDSRDHPYPRKRKLAAARSGDSDAVLAAWESRDRVVGLVRTVVGDAETVLRELRLDPYEYE